MVHSARMSSWARGAVNTGNIRPAPLFPIFGALLTNTSGTWAVSFIPVFQHTESAALATNPSGAVYVLGRLYGGFKAGRSRNKYFFNFSSVHIQSIKEVCINLICALQTAPAG